jgi:hypothetical protein
MVKSYSTNLTEDELHSWLFSNHLPQPDCDLIKSMCVCVCVWRGRGEGGVEGGLT